MGDLNLNPKLKYKLRTLKCFVDQARDNYSAWRYYYNTPRDEDTTIRQNARFNYLYVYEEALEDINLNSYLKKNPKFLNTRRWTDFGSLTYGSDDGELAGDLDYAGKDYGTWYSVDTAGRIRLHDKTTSGLSRSIQYRRSATFKSDTRGGRGTSS